MRAGQPPYFVENDSKQHTTTYKQYTFLDPTELMLLPSFVLSHDCYKHNNMKLRGEIGFYVYACTCTVYAYSIYVICIYISQRQQNKRFRYASVGMKTKEMHIGTTSIFQTEQSSERKKHNENRTHERKKHANDAAATASRAPTTTSTIHYSH